MFHSALNKAFGKIFVKKNLAHVQKIFLTNNLLLCFNSPCKDPASKVRRQFAWGIVCS